MSTGGVEVMSKDRKYEAEYSGSFIHKDQGEYRGQEVRSEEGER